MKAVAPKVKQGTTTDGEPLEISLYYPDEPEIEREIDGLAPVRYPLAVSGWYGHKKTIFEVWRVKGEYFNPSTGQHGPAIRDALPYPVAKGNW